MYVNINTLTIKVSDLYCFLLEVLFAWWSSILHWWRLFEFLVKRRYLVQFGWWAEGGCGQHLPLLLLLLTGSCGSGHPILYGRMCIHSCVVNGSVL